MVLMRVISSIEADKNYDPTPGSFCGLCGVTPHCPVMSQALAPIEVLAPATQEQAEKAASLLLTLQKMEKKLGARLKEWVREYGDVQVGDLVYGPSQVVTYDLHPQIVCTKLLEAGLSKDEVWGLISINKTSLDKGLRKIRRQDLFDLALKTGTVKFSERIDFHKAKR